MTKKKINKVILYESLKAFFIMFCIFILIGWLLTNSIDIIESAFFAILVTGGIMLPLLLSLKIVFPDINKNTIEERKRIFKDQNMPVKLMGLITISMALFFIILWLIVPLFGLSFWQAVASSMGVGFIIASLCTLVVRYIIQLEKPPFQD